MSTTKNLSEKLRQFGATDEDDKWAHLAAEARALEERVAELEQTARENRNWREAHADATARAEAAERLATEWDSQCKERNALWRKAADRAEAAEAEAERWKRSWAETETARMRDSGAHADERDSLRAEVARLREELGAWRDTANQLGEDEQDAIARTEQVAKRARLESSTAWGAAQLLATERDALRAKLDAVRAECERGRSNARLPWRVFASILAILDE